MAIFSSRPSGYKAGVFLLFFAVVVFIVGYAAPTWASADTFLSIKIHAGLWMTCTFVSLDGHGDGPHFCSFWSVRHIAAWFHVVRLLECLCLVGLGLSCIYAVYTNCCRRAFARPVSRFLEIFTAFSGILGFVGCMVYCGMRKHSAERDRDLSHVLATLLDSDGKTMDWAFYLATIGSILSVVAAVVIAVFNKPLDAPASNAAGTVIYTTAVFQGQGQPQGQGYPVVGSYNGQPQPYVHHPPYGQPQLYDQPQSYVHPPPYGEPQPVKAGYPGA
ncbi:uncharacterized protein [Littorina saxatilis]|uniref:Uncharacterized protein n=1 Tax=Littorina saxatilis TaxID=31220 RepID=A0AAN9C0C5_9CAEN